MSRDCTERACACARITYVTVTPFRGLFSPSARETAASYFYYSAPPAPTLLPGVCQHQIRSPSPTLPPHQVRSPPSHTSPPLHPLQQSRALRSLAPRPHRVYVPHSPYLYMLRAYMRACTTTYLRSTSSLRRHCTFMENNNGIIAN